LAQLVAANTGLAGPEAENRWRDRKGSGRDNQISPLAFSVAARLCLLLGAVIAWAAAGITTLTVRGCRIGRDAPQVWTSPPKPNWSHV
jgi:hypothetical protein